MKPYFLFLVAILAILVGVSNGCSPQDESAIGDLVYKIETGGVLAGYAVVDTFLVIENGEELIHLEQRSQFKCKRMGSDLDSESLVSFLLDSTSKQVFRHSGETNTGNSSTRWKLELKDGRFHCSSSLKQDSMVLDLPTDVIVENSLFFDFLVADFAGTDLKEKTYRVLDLADFEIRDTLYEKHIEETLALAGKSFEVVAIDRSVEATGTLMRLWIDTATGMVVKVLEQDGNVITLASPSVMDKVERVDMDKYIFDKTNVAIADVNAITYMKVRAKIRPIGLKPTPELLNVPGQKFTGTVKDNLIEGVFEIEHVPYDGNEAPAFPTRATDPSLAEYLIADGVFQADDEILAAKAAEITASAGDSWEAATLLAAWVSDEINYAIPGGGTARKTYDIKAGECGAHSILLATFCRTLGIPARMVWGCMYTPSLGGSFGQHGWTEVHMGVAGWIPVDATVGETDFVDSGHIRVGHYGSLISRLNAQEFEILEYRVANGSTEATAAVEDRFSSYLGDYRQVGSSQEAVVKVMDGSLVIDLPNQVMLAMDEPDTEGRWVCKMANHLFLIFDTKNLGNEKKAESFTLHEMYSLPRQASAEAIDDRVPEDLKPCLGSYHMAALNADFAVTWVHNRLALKHPRYEHALPLTPTGEDGAWKTKDGPYTISFVTAEDGQVASLTLDAVSEFRKK